MKIQQYIGLYCKNTKYCNYSSTALNSITLVHIYLILTLGVFLLLILKTMCQGGVGHLQLIVFNCSLYYTVFHTYSFFTFNFTSLYSSYIYFISIPFFSLCGTFWVAITLLAQESRVTCHSHTRMVYWQCAGLEPPTLWLQDQHTNHYTILSPLEYHNML